MDRRANATIGGDAAGVRPVSDATFAFEQVDAASTRLRSDAHLGKVVIAIGG